MGPKALFASSTGSTGEAIMDLNAPNGMSAQQQHVNETLEEKKRRIFRWNAYERIMIPLE